jgi:hypothetical protein
MSNIAVDIAILNGVGARGASGPNNGNPEFREFGNRLKDALVQLGYTWNTESGNDKAVLWQTNTGGNHYNHLHVSNKSGASDAELEKLSFSSGSVVTVETVKTILEKLKQRGVTSEDLKKLIDQSVSGITQKIDVSNFETITNVVIKTFEGGYYHPDMLKDGRVKDSRYGNSGETMFGIDRKAGGKMTNEGPAAQEFWKLIDDANARTNWQWNYMGGPLESKLRKLTSDIIKPYFVSNINRFLNPEAREIVLNNKKLMVNFAYATWNGPGWFQKFANVINDEVKSGTTDPEELSDILIKTRLNSGNSLVAQGGKKMEKLINSMA